MCCVCVGGGGGVVVVVVVVCLWSSEEATTQLCKYRKGEPSSGFLCYVNERLLTCCLTVVMPTKVTDLFNCCHVNEMLLVA